MPTMLSVVIRATDRSMSVKAYHATALAPQVNMAIPLNARNSLALMPKGALPSRLRPVAADFEVSASTRAAALFLNPLLFVAARDEGGSRRSDLGALLGETERSRHADDALRGDPLYGPVYVGESIPRDRAGAAGQHGHTAEREKQLSLDAIRRLAVALAIRGRRLRGRRPRRGRPRQALDRLRS